MEGKVMGAGADERLNERTQFKAEPPAVEFPLYLMKVGEKRQFMPLREAGVTFDSGWVEVDIGGLVLEADFSVRDITKEEIHQIQEIADAHSASK